MEKLEGRVRTTVQRRACEVKLNCIYSYSQLELKIIDTYIL